MERTPILKKSRLQRIGLFAIATFFVFTGSLQAEPMAGKPPLTVVSTGGTYTKNQMLAFINPYREMKNRWVNVEDHNGGWHKFVSRSIHSTSSGTW